MEDYLLPGGMHPDLKKFLCRDDSQRRNASGFDEIPGTQNAAVSAGQNSIRNCPDRRFPKQNTILQFHFRNKTPLHSGAGVLTIIINKASKNAERMREHQGDREHGE